MISRYELARYAPTSRVLLDLLRHPDTLVADASCYAGFSVALNGTDARALLSDPAATEAHRVAVCTLTDDVEVVAEVLLAEHTAAARAGASRYGLLGQLEHAAYTANQHLSLRDVAMLACPSSVESNDRLRARLRTASATQRLELADLVQVAATHGNQALLVAVAEDAQDGRALMALVDLAMRQPQPNAALIDRMCARADLPAALATDPTAAGTRVDAAILAAHVRHLDREVYRGGAVRQVLYALSDHAHLDAVGPLMPDTLAALTAVALEPGKLLRRVEAGPQALRAVAVRLMADARARGTLSGTEQEMVETIADHPNADVTTLAVLPVRHTAAVGRYLRDTRACEATWSVAVEALSNADPLSSIGDFVGAIRVAVAGR